MMTQMHSSMNSPVTPKQNLSSNNPQSLSSFEESTIQDNLLRIGDIITLKVPKFNSFLSSEGLILEDVYLSNSSLNFEEHLFQIYIQRQYSANNELEEYRKNANLTPLTTSHVNETLLDNMSVNSYDNFQQSTNSHNDALVRGKDNESVLNINVMRGKIGNPISFGDTIQLLHVKSQKFITVNSSSLARDERENMKVTLTYDGNVFSWLKLMPRFKIDREGEFISNNSEVFLKIAEKPTEYIHASNKPPPRTKYREVNSSLELPTNWKLSIFHRSTELDVSENLLCGQTIVFRDPEVHALLAPIKMPISLKPTNPISIAALGPGGSIFFGGNQGSRIGTGSIISNISNEGSSAPPSRGLIRGSSLTNFSRSDFESPLTPMTPFHSNNHFNFSFLNTNNEESSMDKNESETDDDLSINSTEEFSEANGIISLRLINKKNSSDFAIESDAIWVIESRFINKGGTIRPDIDRVHFRHFMTGRYLSVYEKPSSPGEFLFGLEDEPSEKKTLFCIQEVHGSTSSGILLNGRGIQIKHNYYNFYLQRGEYHDDHSLYTVQPTKSRGKAVSIILFRYHQPYDNSHSSLKYLKKVFATSHVNTNTESHLSSRPNSSARKNTANNTDITATKLDSLNNTTIVSNSSKRSNKNVQILEHVHLHNLGEVYDIYFAKAFHHHLDKYVKHTCTPYLLRTEVSHIWPRLDLIDRNLFPQIMARATLFLKGYSIRIPLLEELPKIQPKEEIIRTRQNMLREVGVLQDILLMIKFLQPISDLVNYITMNPQGQASTTSSLIISTSMLGNLGNSSNSNRSNENSVKLPKNVFIQSGKAILEECLNLLFELIRNNPKNQDYIANHLLIIFSHVNTNVMAATIAQELLSSNRELQENKINENIITAFTEKMKTVPMNSMYLKLLRTCCSCNSKGLSKNQGIITNILFDQYKSVLIDLKTDYNKVTQVDWVKSDAISHITSLVTTKLSYGGFRRSIEIASNGMKGQSLLTNGVPLVTAKWDIHIKKFLPISSFSKEEVPLNEIMKYQLKYNKRNRQSLLDNGNNSSSSNGETISVDEFRKQVGNFLIAQLELAAELCLDRHYYTINMLENIYPYELLVSILKMSSNSELKAAAAYLIHHLYINRDPQNEVTLPRLTRVLVLDFLNTDSDSHMSDLDSINSTSSHDEIFSDSNSDFVMVPQANQECFALIQYIITSHLQEIVGKPFPSHTYEILGMLQSLISFHFYGDIKLMKGLIDSLIKILYRSDQDNSDEANRQYIFNVYQKLNKKNDINCRRMQLVANRRGKFVVNDEKKVKLNYSRPNNVLSNAIKLVKSISKVNLFERKSLYSDTDSENSDEASEESDSYIIRDSDDEEDYTDSKTDKIKKSFFSIYLSNNDGTFSHLKFTGFYDRVKNFFVAYKRYYKSKYKSIKILKKLKKKHKNLYYNFFSFYYIYHILMIPFYYFIYQISNFKRKNFTIIKKLFHFFYLNYYYNLLMLGFILFFCAFTLYEDFFNKEKTYFNFELIFFFIFAIELAIKILLYILKYSSITLFFINFINLAEFLYVGLFLLFYFHIKNLRVLLFLKFLKLSRILIVSKAYMEKTKFSNQSNSQNNLNSNQDYYLMNISPPINSFNSINTSKLEVKSENFSNWKLNPRYYRSSEYTIKILVRILEIFNLIMTNSEDRFISIFMRKLKNYIEKQVEKTGVINLITNFNFKEEDINELFLSTIIQNSDILVINENSHSSFSSGFSNNSSSNMNSSSNINISSSSTSIPIQSKESSASVSNKKNLLIDMLMYSNTNLFYQTILLLMRNFSTGEILLENLNKLQLITSKKVNKKFNTIKNIIETIKKYSDTFDIWYKLNKKEHININKNFHSNLNLLIKESKKPSLVIKIDENFEESKRSIQNILRNLNFFSIALKILQFYKSYINNNNNYNNNFNIKNNFKKLCQLTTTLLYWFCLNNKENQTIVYSELNFFITLIDDNINIHRVINSIFYNNLSLMEQVPKQFISDFFDLIFNVGKFPQYLSLMSSILSLKEKNVIENQYEVIRIMSSPENQKKVLLFFGSTDSSEYKKKLKLMAPYIRRNNKVNTNNTSSSKSDSNDENFVDITSEYEENLIESLPNELIYHLDLMKLLSLCTVGRTGMTTIEAKVQSMFHFTDIIYSMIDHHCLLRGKIRLGELLYNAFLDVETIVPAMKDAHCLWLLFKDMLDNNFKLTIREIKLINETNWFNKKVNKEILEYFIINIYILNSYFKNYYNPNIFNRFEINNNLNNNLRIKFSESECIEIIQQLFETILTIYEFNNRFFAYDHQLLIYNTLKLLNYSAKNPYKFDQQFTFHSWDSGKDNILSSMSNDDIDTNLLLRNNFTSSFSSKITQISDSISLIFEKILITLNNSEIISNFNESQILQFVNTLDSLPSKYDSTVNSSVSNDGQKEESETYQSSNSSHHDLRFEPLIERLVVHIRSSIITLSLGDQTTRSFPSKDIAKTSMWVIKSLRLLIEKKWGMTIYERDDDGGEEQDNSVAGLMKVYNLCCVPQMCLDLIVKGIDISVQAEALKLLVAMLFKEGGALEIQKTIHSYLSSTNSTLFFQTVRQIFHNLMSWHSWNGIILLDEGVEPKLPEEIIIIRCLQLMCEGHFQPNQDLLREQLNNDISINLLDDMILYLQCLDNIKCRTSTSATLTLSALILEVCQGPCEGNQEYFAINTELIEILNRKLRQSPVNDCDPLQELEVKRATIDIFQGLLEGQGRKHVVFERMLSVVHVDVILVLCRGNHLKNQDSSTSFIKNSSTFDDILVNKNNQDSSQENFFNILNKQKKEEEEPKVSLMLRTESLVLLQMLMDYRPSLREELGLQLDSLTQITSSNNSNNNPVACIEVVWKNEIQRRFFHIPLVCSNLAKSTKDSFILNVKRDSLEDKLYSLLEISHEIYREILHQQNLKNLPLNFLFSKTILDHIVWFNFYIVLLLNIIFIIFYTVQEIPCNLMDQYKNGYSSVDSSGNIGIAGIDNGKVNFSLMSSPIKYITHYNYYEGTISEGLAAIGIEEFIANDGKDYCNIITLQYNFIENIIFFLVLLLIIGSFYSFICTLIVHAPLMYQKFLKSQIQKEMFSVQKYSNFFFGIFSNINNFFTLLTYQGLTTYYFIYFILAIASLFYSPILSFLLLDFIKLSPTVQSVLIAVYNPRKQLFLTIILTLIIIYIFAIFNFFFYNQDHIFFIQDTSNNLGNLYKFLLRWGLPQNSPQNQVEPSIDERRVVSDISFFLSCIILLNILKGITIDTFVELRKVYEARMKDTQEKCFICGIEKNVFNRTLDRDAFEHHVKYEQNLWNYIYFIIYIWEQDKDDDDGLESFVRKCIDQKDLVWFPINKAMRLSEHQFKGDIHSLKYRFHQDMLEMENNLKFKMNELKMQMTRNISRVEKGLEFDNENEKIRSKSKVLNINSSFNSKLVRFGTHENLLENIEEEDTATSSSVQSITPTNARGAARGRGGGFKPGMILNLHEGADEKLNPSSLNEEKTGQLHLRVVNVTGLLIHHSFVKYLKVKVISSYQSIILNPIVELENIEDSTASPDGRDLSISHSRNSSFLAGTPNKVGSVTNNSIMQAIQDAQAAVNQASTETSFSSKKMELKKQNSFKSSDRPLSLRQGSISKEDRLRSISKSFNSGKQLPNTSSSIVPTKAISDLKFDSKDNPSILAHQGTLPKIDLNKIFIHVQILFCPPTVTKQNDILSTNTSNTTIESTLSTPIFLAGVKISLPTLLNQAHLGTQLDLPFQQRAIEVSLPVSSVPPSLLTNPQQQSSATNNGNSSTVVFMPASDTGVLSISCMATYKLLQEWAFHSTNSIDGNNILEPNIDAALAVFK